MSGTKSGNWTETQPVGGLVSENLFERRTSCTKTFVYLKGNSGTGLT